MATMSSTSRTITGFESFLCAAHSERVVFKIVFSTACERPSINVTLPMFVHSFVFVTMAI
eukprot:m.87086 g.87086  ORF g.87086 m.87086 type:complete len:60 (+) comp11524_c1_seq2:226-405(+)